MSGFGGMHEKGGRARAGKRGGKLSADVTGFAHAAYNDAAAAREKKADGPSEMIRVKRIGKISDGLRFVQEHFASEFDGAVAVGSSVHRKNEIR